MQERTWLRDFATPFFQACERNELIVPRCDSCGSFFWYPTALCGVCHAADWHWEPVVGRGRIYSFTVVHRPLSSEIPAPYVIATVELDEGIRMMSNIIECATDELEIETPVEAVFDELERSLCPLLSPGPRGGSVSSPGADWHLVYHRRVTDLVQELGSGQAEPIARAAEILAASWESGGRLLIAKTHHALHHEATLRAGGPVAVDVLDDVSTYDDAQELLNLRAGDVVVIHSNSGTHGKAVGIALLAREGGAQTIGLAQLPYSLSPFSKVGHPRGRAFTDVVDVHVDLGGDVGDASIDVPGSELGVAPTSGVTGFAAFWMIVAHAYEIMLTHGKRLVLRESHNFEGGESRNAERVERYRVTALAQARSSKTSPSRRDSRRAARRGR